MATLKDTINPKTAAQLKEEIRIILSKNGFSADDWNTGSDSRSILEAEGASLEDLWNTLVLITNGGYLPTATGDWLDLLADSFFQITRIPTEFTKGVMNLTLNPALGGPYTISAGSLLISDGVRNYRNINTVPVTVNNAQPTASIEFMAESPGESYNIIAGTINTATTPSQNKTPLVGLTIDNKGVQTAAKAIGLYLAGPFNVNGKTLVLTVTENGVDLAPQTLTFTSNYIDMSFLINGLNALILANPVLTGKITASLSTINSLQIATTKPGLNEIGASQGILINIAGTANSLVGYSSVYNTKVIGSSGWITQPGRDKESDSSLVTRCKQKWGVLGAGTADAFNYWTREASPFVQKSVVFSHYLNGAVVPGAVTIYIAGANSALDVAPLNTTKDTVEAYIKTKMPIMSQLFVGNAVSVPIDISAEVTIKSTADSTKVLTEIYNEIQKYASSLQIGETAYLDKIRAAISCNTNVLTHTLFSPITDRIPQKNQFVTFRIPTPFTVKVR